MDDELNPIGVSFEVRGYQVKIIFPEDKRDFLIDSDSEQTQQRCYNIFRCGVPFIESVDEAIGADIDEGVAMQILYDCNELAQDEIIRTIRHSDSC